MQGADLKYDLEIQGTQTLADFFPLICDGNDRGVPNCLLSKGFRFHSLH